MPKLLFDSPYDWFATWFQEATSTDMIDPNAMTLATVDADGQPSARTVLLKAYDENGFVFYTNTLSRKGAAIAAENRVALLFYWRGLDRQIRIEGEALPVAGETADNYFSSRGRGSQIGAWASQQSTEIANRDILADRVANYEKQYPKTVPRPAHWSGYRVDPTHIEFWQAGDARLHDRWRFTKVAASWTVARLAP